jgi:hypothetical protein
VVRPDPCSRDIDWQISSAAALDTTRIIHQDRDFGGVSLFIKSLKGQLNELGHPLSCWRKYAIPSNTLLVFCERTKICVALGVRVPMGRVCVDGIMKYF